MSSEVSPIERAIYGRRLVHLSMNVAYRSNLRAVFFDIKIEENTVVASGGFGRGRTPALCEWNEGKELGRG
jgi:hypothetical protein